jgi:hypothetical protein
VNVAATVLMLVLNAQSAPRPDAAPPTDGAEGIFKAALVAYDVGEYQRAIDLFQDAYRRAPKPEILFDIAQSYGALGRCAPALEALDRVLGSEHVSDQLRSRSQSRRSELTDCHPRSMVNSAPATETASTPAVPTLVIAPVVPPSPGVESRPSVLISSRPAPERRGTSLAKSACVATFGATLTLATVGAVVGIDAHSAERAIEGVQTWNADAERQDERGRTLGRLGTELTLAAGSAALLAGTACFVWWRFR